MTMEVFAAVLTGISCLLLTFNVFGNLLVIVVVHRNRKSCSADAYLLSNLAYSDLTFALLSFVNISLLSAKTTQDSLPKFTLHALTSIFTLAALAVERYFAILKPFMHLTKATKSFLWKAMLAIWIIAGILCAPGYIIQGKMDKGKNMTTNATRVAPAWVETVNIIYPFILVVFGLILPSAIIMFCYSRVIYHVWFHADANRTTNIALLKSRRKLTKLFIIITVIFLITWTPTFGRFVLRQYIFDAINFWKFELSTIFLGLVGSTANPVIYSFRCPRFRQEVLKLLTCRCCKGKRRPTVHVFFMTKNPVGNMERRSRTPAEPVLILKTTSFSGFNERIKV